LLLIPCGSTPSHIGFTHPGATIHVDSALHRMSEGAMGRRSEISSRVKRNKSETSEHWTVIQPDPDDRPHWMWGSGFDNNDNPGK
jgi:hypothetical protein